jgi:HlyD family secretion protein
VNQNLISQKWIMERELDISEKQFEREKILYNQKVTASQDFEKAESILWQQKRNYKNTEASILNNELRIAELQNRIAELKTQIGEREMKLYASFQNSLQNLKSQYNIWKNKYLLESPLDGKLTYLRHFANQEYIQNDQEIAVVIPDSKKNIGKIDLPLNSSGKVHRGQKVNIKLHNFPAEEFGILEGQIDDVSLILQEGEKGEKKYHLTITLPERIETSYKKELPNSSELQGEAHIITQDLRLIERIFYQFVKALKR